MGISWYMHCKSLFEGKFSWQTLRTFPSQVPSANSFEHWPVGLELSRRPTNQPMVGIPNKNPAFFQYCSLLKIATAMKSTRKKSVSEGNNETWTIGTKNLGPKFGVEPGPASFSQNIAFANSVKAGRWCLLEQTERTPADRIASWIWHPSRIKLLDLKLPIVNLTPQQPWWSIASVRAFVRAFVWKV